MNAILKGFLKAAAITGGVYLVGRTCYNIGRDMAEIEHQLEKSARVDNPKAETHKEDPKEPVADVEVKEEPKTEEPEAPKPKTRLDKAIDKIKNAKMFLAVRKAWSKKDKTPGVLGSLLMNPDGAKIEAVVRDGGVHIDVRPRK